MTWQEFRKTFSGFPLFSLQYIMKADRSFHRRRLVEWQGKGYIKKLANAWYCFADMRLDEPFLFLASNKIYQPSYISLESALAYYGFIPEGVFNITAVSTLKTNQFKSEAATFRYRNVKEELFWGYALVPTHAVNFKIAFPEKALLDYLYFNRHINTSRELEHLRLNKSVIKKAISQKRLKLFCRQYNNARLNGQTDSVLKYLRHA